MRTNQYRADTMLILYSLSYILSIYIYISGINIEGIMVLHLKYLWLFSNPVVYFLTHSLIHFSP